jgi:hypothetical protein
MLRILRIAVLALCLLALGDAAAAQDYRPTVPPTSPDTGPTSTQATTPTSSDVSVLPTVQERPSTTQGGGAVVPPGDSGSGVGRHALSRTGSDVLPQVLIALALILCGVVVSVAARRRRRTAAVV